jgi:hypothetical protein
VSRTAPATAELALIALAVLGGAVRSALADARSAGERFYLTGLGASGRVATAVVQGDLRVTSAEMPCAGCHRRSGWAGSEGTLTVAPVAAPALFAPVTRGSRELGAVRTSGAGTRPAYTDETLLRAVREGIDAGGRPLAPAMPRYALGDEDASSLVEHLRSLSAAPPPGLTPSEVHLATVTSQEVDAADRQAVLEVLRAFVRDKNAGTRNETRRRERGPWDMRQHYDAYRGWVLHEWELKGPASAWPAQLARLYEAEPVFALVAGAVEVAAPLHEFAERNRVPLVLPQTPVPAVKPPGDSFYALYFSRAAALEADLLVQRVARGGVRRLLQIARCGSADAAVVRVAQNLPSGIENVTRCWAEPVEGGPRPLDPAAAETAVALWLDAATAGRAIDGLPAATRAVFVSSSFAGGRPLRFDAAFAQRVLLLESQVPEPDLDRHAGRSLAWLKARGLSHLPTRVALNALYSMLLVAEALSHPTALVSREYFVERIVGMAARSPHRSAYPEVAFGPQRRFGSAGGYLLEVSPSPEGVYRKVGEWTVPR